jgi:polyhydroxyalkanoate synthesis regulator phasin
MNPDQLLQTLQKGYRVSIGATASMIESLQDSQRRDENFAKLRSDPNQLIEDLAIKGETTEREARNFVDSVFQNRPGSNETSSTAPPAASSVIQQDLQALTAQLAAIRAELERLRA